MRENFISRAEDEESNAKVNPIDNNKTLIIDQYTNEVGVGDPELLEKAKTLKDVMDYFKPKVEVEFTDEEGGSVNEVLQFKEMGDFEVAGGRGKLVANSPFLSNTKSTIDINAKLRKQIEQNKKLRDILKDKQAKDELRVVLESLLEELKNS
jgi:hypothetical protein